MTRKITDQTMALVNEKQNPEKLPYESPTLIELSMSNDVVRGESGYDDGGTGEEEYED